MTELDVDREFPHLVRLWNDDRVLLSTWKGELGVLQDGRWTWRSTGVGALRRLVVLDDERVAVLGEQGRVRVHDLSVLSDGIDVPVQADDVFAQNGDLIVVGTDVQRWTIPKGSPTSWTQPGGGGVAYLDVSPTGSRLIAGHGSGEQTVFDTQTGRARPFAEPMSRVAKPGTFLDENRVFASWEDQLVLFDLSTGQREAWPGGRLSRAIPFGDGVLALGGRALSYTTAQGRQWTQETVLTDAVAVPGGAWTLDREGVVRRWAPWSSEPVSSTAFFPAGGRLAVDEQRVVRATSDVVEAFTHDQQLLWRASLSAPATALDGSGPWVAVGDAHGALRLYDRDGTLRAHVVHAHERRVSGLRFHGTTLYTASFDGVVRRWDLDDLDTPAEDLTGRWPEELQDALY